MQNGDDRICKEKPYKYIFSIVVAVYNSEPFLRQTLDSIVNQNISGLFRFADGKKTKRLVPFSEAVQVITVDDGSSDTSGKICDEYAEKYSNFLSIHKANGGVSSARNEGLKYVEGKYMNFLDSDDKFSPNVLVSIYNFFEENYSKTDVVTMPLYFFDAVTGAHWQNYKFRKYNCVVDLYNEYDSPLMFVNASFFKSEYKDKILFDPRLVCGEDMKYILTLISEKMTMGLVSKCRYFYRRRSSGEQSLIQTAKKKIGWYFDYFLHLIEWGVNFAKEKWGYIPYYFQNILVCDLKWRFLNEYENTALELLGVEEYNRYKEVLFASLSHFDDKIILGQRSIYKEHKAMMLEKKYGRLPEKCIYLDDIALRYENTVFCWLSSCYSLIEFVKISEGNLIIEGFTTVLGIAPEDAFDVYISIRKKGEKAPTLIPCEEVKRDASLYKLSEVLFRAVPFRCKLSLSGIVWSELSLVCIWNSHTIVKKDIRYGKFSPIGTEYKKSYYYSDGYIVTRKDHYLYLEECSAGEYRKRERAFISELNRSKKESDRKAALAIRTSKVLSFFKRKRLWLIMDRPDRADDNGEAFFRYLAGRKPKNIDFRFVISSESVDYEKLSKLGKVVPYKSKMHKLLYLLSDAVISSHADDFIISPFEDEFLAPYRRFTSEKRFIFLQHGVTRSDVSKWLNKYKTNISGFVTAAIPERQSIIDYGYNYNEDEVWLTGFPRFDYLYNEPKKIISVIPTWRAYLVNNYQRLDDKSFVNSEFFRFYKALFQDARLRKALSKYGYEMKFKMHPRMYFYKELLSRDGEIELWGEEDSYRKIFAETSLLVTDYSSVSMDFAYLRKPIIYCQFDKDKFYSGEHTLLRGYFDDERDGFGEVSHNVEETVDLIIDYIKSGCGLKECYRQRIDNFFAFDDKNNSKRIFEKIIETD